MSVFVALRGQVSGPVAGHRLSADANLRLTSYVSSTGTVGG